MSKYKDIEMDIVSSYKELKSVWKVGDKFSIPGQTIHKILSDCGAIRKMNYFTDEDMDILKSNYSEYADNGNLKLLAKKLGRTIPFICRKAKDAGLTNNSRPFSGDRDMMSTVMTAYIKENGHPRGFLNGKHSEDTKIGFSNKNKRLWADPESKFNSDEFRQKQSDRMVEYQKNNPSSNNYSRTKKGWWDNGSKRYFMRSSWEMNYACYLDFLLKHKEIVSWEYEIDTFWFEKIKRGVRSYTPDFKVISKNGETSYHEVKGWMDAKSKTKLNRMRIYYPEIKMELIDSSRYKSIMKNSSMFVKNHDSK